MKARRLLAALVLVLFGFLPSLALGQPRRPPPVPPEEQKIIIEQTRVFMEILVYYAALSLDKPADLRACAAEMLRMKPNEQSCRDKYSAWHPREGAQEIDIELKGKFGGVGLELSQQDGKVVVVSPIDGTPAYRAGLKSGDVIVRVDGKAVADIRDAVKRMRGKPGVEVEITILRSGHEVAFKVVREEITIHAVSSKVIDGPSGKIGYIKVKIFSEVLPAEFREKMYKLRAEGVERVILDFRNNPGGLFWEALEILYEFARPGDIFVTFRERTKSTVYDTAYLKKELELEREPGAFRDTKVVILVNKGSASASEIFTGTMKDWGFSVVGTETFKKGVGQQVIPLSDGSMLRLTTFEFLVGNSKTKIEGIGVVPTYEVPDPQASSSETLREDKQMEKAIEILSR